MHSSTSGLDGPVGMSYVKKKDKDRRERNEKRGICMPPRNEDVAVLGIVVTFGIEHVEITATVGTYKLFFFDSDAPTLSQASRGL